jgi:hypothetical protein
LLALLLLALLPALALHLLLYGLHLLHVALLHLAHSGKYVVILVAKRVGTAATLLLLCQRARYHLYRYGIALVSMAGTVFGGNGGDGKSTLAAGLQHIGERYALRGNHPVARYRGIAALRLVGATYYHKVGIRRIGNRAQILRIAYGVLYLHLVFDANFGGTSHGRENNILPVYHATATNKQKHKEAVTPHTIYNAFHF